MTKKLFKSAALIMVMLVSAYSVSAQKIEWGTKNKANSKWYSPTVSFEDGENIYTTSLGYNKRLIEKHDKKGNIIFSNNIKLNKIDKKIPDVEYLTFLKDRFILLVSCYNNSDDKEVLYSLSYDGKTGKLMGKEKKILEVPVEKEKRKGSFLFFVSQDQSKILVNHFAYYKSEGKVKDRYKLFDNEMNMLMEKTEVINKKEIDYLTMNYIIDNDGSVYFLKKMNSGKAFIVSYDATKDYEKWEEMVDLSKLEKNQSVRFLKFAMDPKNDLVIAGICFEKQKKEDVPCGTMYMKVDGKSKEVKVFKTQKFPISSWLSNMMFTFENQTMHFTSNNDLVFISQVNAIRPTRFNQIYYDGDLVIAKYNQEGELEWSKVIPKIQESRVGDFINLLYFSYISGVDKDKLFIIYNDRSKNLNLASNKKVKIAKKFRKTVPFLCTIDLADGKMNTRQLFDPKTQKNYLKAKIRYQKDYRSDIISIAQYRGHYQVVRIKLDDKS